MQVQFNVKEEHVDAFVGMMNGAKQWISSADGCQDVELLLSTENPQKIILSEIWDTKEKHDAFAEKMQEQGSLDQLASFLNGQPESEFYLIK